MKKFLNVYTKITDKICYGMSFFSMAMIVIMMFLMFIDVMLSLIFNYRILGAYEVTTIALLILVFSSWAYTQTVHGHIHVVMFVRMFPQKIRFLFFGLTSLISVITMGYASYATFVAIGEKMKSGEATANLLIPYWPLYIFEFAAFALLTIVLIKDTLKAFVAMFDNEMADEIQSTWA